MKLIIKIDYEKFLLKGARSQMVVKAFMDLMKDKKGFEKDYGVEVDVDYEGDFAVVMKFDGEEKAINKIKKELTKSFLNRVKLRTIQKTGVKITHEVEK